MEFDNPLLSFPINATFVRGEWDEKFPIMHPSLNYKVLSKVLVSIDPSDKDKLNRNYYVPNRQIIPESRANVIPLSRNYVDVYRQLKADEFGDYYVIDDAHFIIKEYDVTVASSAYRETSAMQYIQKNGNHPNIVNFHECIEYTKMNVSFKYYLITEMCDGQNLSVTLSTREQYKPYPEEEAKDVFKNMLKGINFLHSHGIAHQDISPENMVIDTETYIKLIDFEMSVYIPRQVYGDQVSFVPIMSCGKHLYNPPEMYNTLYRHFNPFAKDMWSAGVVLYWMLTRDHPFIFPSPIDPAFIAICIEYQLPQIFEVARLGHLSEEVIDLLKHLLDPNPITRFSAEQTLYHDWFTK